MKKKLQKGGTASRDTRGEPLTRSSVTAQSLLKGATGKDSFTEADIRNLAIKQGYSQRDVNSIVKGFNQSQGKSIEFMDNMKEFNVFDGSEQKGGAVASGKRTGNKKGFDAGDLIGLGSNVNRFAGFAAGLKPAPAAAKAEEPTVPLTGSGEGINIGYDGDSKTEKSKSNTNTGTGGGGKGNGLTPKQFDIPTGLNLPPGFGQIGPGGFTIGYEPDNGGYRIGEKPAGIGQRAIDLINKGGFQTGTMKQPEVEGPGRFEDFMNRMLASGHSTVRWTADNVADLAEAMGTPRDEQGLFQPLYEMAKKYEDDRRAGRNKKYDDEFIYNTLAQTPEIVSASRVFIGAPLAFMRGAGMSIPGSAFAKAAASKLGKAAYPYFEGARRFAAKKFSGSGVKAAGSAPVTSGATKSGATTIMQTKALPQGTASSPKLLPEYKTIITPPPGSQQVTAQKLLGQGTPRTQTVIEGTPVVNPNVTYKGTSPRSKIIKERSAQMAEGYKKGGKIYAQKGARFPWDMEGTEVDLTGGSNQGELNPMFTAGNQVTPSVTQGNTFAVQTGGTPNTKTDIIPQTMSRRDARKAGIGTQSYRAMREINTKGRKDIEGVGDGLGNAVKYALPFIGEAIARRQLKTKPIQFKPSNLMTGAVQDLARNYRPMLNKPQNMGVDFLSNQAGQKFTQAYNADKEFQWDLQNQMSRQQQRENILNRTNQGKMFDAQREQQVDMANAQMNAGLSGLKYQSIREPFISAQHHLAGDRSTNAYVKSSERAALYDTMVKNPDFYGGINNPAYQAKLRELENPKRGGFFGKKGMKFKIRK